MPVRAGQRRKKTYNEPRLPLSQSTDGSLTAEANIRISASHNRDSRGTWRRSGWKRPTNFAPFLPTQRRFHLRISKIWMRSQRFLQIHRKAATEHTTHRHTQKWACTVGWFPPGEIHSSPTLHRCHHSSLDRAIGEGHLLSSFKRTRVS